MQKFYYISTLTWKMLEQMKGAAVEKYARKYAIDPALIKAIIKKESGNNPFAMRLETHLKKAHWYQSTLKGIKEVANYHHSSFGLMQMMYGTARHIGFLFNPFSLFNPTRAIRYGTKYLAWCIKRYKGRIWDGVSAYNQGNNRFFDINKNGIKDAHEKYYNQEYVDMVKEYFKKFKETG